MKGRHQSDSTACNTNHDATVPVPALTLHRGIRALKGTNLLGRHGGIDGMMGPVECLCVYVFTDGFVFALRGKKSMWMCYSGAVSVVT